MFLPIVSGSSGNCTLVSDGKTFLLADCGLPLKRLEDILRWLGLSPESLTAVLITHEHSDHIKGAGFVSRKYGLPVFATEETHIAMENSHIPEKCIQFVTPDTDFEIGTIGVKSFPIPHDAANPVGYSFFCGNNKLSIATDIGVMTDCVLDNIKNSIAVILESNHDIEMLKSGRYPYFLKHRILSEFGHLSNKDAAKTVLELVKSGTTHIMLGHLSNENNTPGLAYSETAGLLSENGIIAGRDFSLSVAYRYSPTWFSSLKNDGKGENK